MHIFVEIKKKVMEENSKLLEKIGGFNNIKDNVLNLVSIDKERIDDNGLNIELDSLINPEIIVRPNILR